MVHQRMVRAVPVLVASLLFGELIAAAEPAGRPDFTGVWQAYALQPLISRGDGPALTAMGEARVKAFYATYGDDMPEAGAFCVPPGMPATMTALVGYPIEVLQTRDRLTMLAEMEMQVRRIFIDGRKHPSDYPATRMGYSIGQWQGATLVVDTALLQESLLRPWPRSEQTRIRERISLTRRADVKAPLNAYTQNQKPVNDAVLAIELTITDPDLYQQPVTTTVYYQRIADDSTLEYDCPSDLWHQALQAAED
ncbi:MAG: hypothetical protein IT494_05620 [Gammaproteobacteria bacterium]|nr:hypothetical protein [Gammaproteobacteria bacterium]